MFKISNTTMNLYHNCNLYYLFESTNLIMIWTSGYITDEITIARIKFSMGTKYVIQV